MGPQRRFQTFAVLIAVLLKALPAAAQGDVVTLDGKSLTIKQVVQVAVQKASVKIDPAAMDRVSQSFNLLIAAAEQGIAIYGLNYGVGENKDKPVFPGKLTPKDCDASRQFNRNNLFATSAGAGPE